MIGVGFVFFGGGGVGGFSFFPIFFFANRILICLAYNIGFFVAPPPPQLLPSYNTLFTYHYLTFGYQQVSMNKKLFFE